MANQTSNFKSIINDIYTHYLLVKINEKLKYYIENNIFDNRYELKILTLEKKDYIYQHNNFWYEYTKNEYINGFDELILYNIDTVINLFQLYQEEKINLYGVDITIVEKDLYYNFIYKPNTIANIQNIKYVPDDIRDEYIETYNIFKNIDIFNNNIHSYLPINKAKVTFSINGLIFNKPNREYFVVMNDNNNYNIQVYELNMNKKRKTSILGIFIILDENRKINISEPFFTNYKFKF